MQISQYLEAALYFAFELTCDVHPGLVHLSTIHGDPFLNKRVQLTNTMLGLIWQLSFCVYLPAFSISDLRMHLAVYVCV